MWLGWYYLESGDTTRAVQYYRDKIEEDPYDCEVHYRLAGLQERIEDLRGALTTIDAMTEYCPDHRDAVISAVQICLRFNLIDEALRHVDDWIARHPNDESMIRSRQQLLERSTQTPDSVPGNQ
jgi:tetratricopeptide (TPR) repeat protein